MAFLDHVFLWTTAALVAAGVVSLGIWNFKHRATLTVEEREREDQETSEDAFFW